MVANLLGVVDALALTRAHSYHQIILLALPLGLIEALASASLDAIPPRILPDDKLVRANALLGGAQDLAIVVGPVLAAVVNSHWGISGAFYVDAATFLVGALVALRLRVGRLPRDTTTETSTWHELREGGRLARRTRGLRWTLGVAASIYALWAVFGVLEPLYVRDVLGEGDAVFALLQTVFGIGLVTTGLVLAAWGERLVRPAVLGSAVIASGITAALYLGTSSIVVAFVGVFLWGIDVAFFYVPGRTLLQRYAPIEFHGRVMSLNHSLEPAAGIVMTPLAAIALTVIGVQALGVIGGLVAAVGGLFILRAALRLGPVPAAGPVDATAVSARDTIALGGSAPG